MASTKKKAAKAGSGAISAGKAARSNPYVQRVIENSVVYDRPIDMHDVEKLGFAGNSAFGLKRHALFGIRVVKNWFAQNVPS